MGSGAPLRVIVALLALCLSATASAEPLDVAFAGIAHLGDADRIARDYPITAPLVAAGEPGARASDALLRRLIALPNPTFRLFSDHLASLTEGDTALVACLVIERENVSVEALGGEYKVLAEVSAQALFFDFKSMTVAAAYPVAVQYVDVRSTPPTPTQLGAVLAELFDGSLGVSLLNEAQATFSSLALRTQVGSRLQIRDVKIEAPARSVMPERLERDPAATENLLASQFARHLSTNLGVAVLPRSKGHAIGNAMAMRFADGRVFSLRIPEADYVFDLTIRGFKKVETEKRGAGSVWVYGAYAQLVLSEPLSSKIFLDLKLKNGESKIIPASQTRIDHWAAWQESLQVLFHEVATALGQPTATWAARHADGAEALPQLRAAKEVMDSCR